MSKRELLDDLVAKAKAAEPHIRPIDGKWFARACFNPDGTLTPYGELAQEQWEAAKRRGA